MLRRHYPERDKPVLGDERIAFGVVFESHFNVGIQIRAFFDIFAVTAVKTANGFVAADDFQPFAEHLRGEHFHRRVFQVGAHKMSLYARRIDFFKEIDRHPEIDVAHAFDGKPDRIFAGIEHAVLSGAVVFEFE